MADKNSATEPKSENLYEPENTGESSNVLPKNNLNSFLKDKQDLDPQPTTSKINSNTPVDKTSNSKPATATSQPVPTPPKTTSAQKPAKLKSQSEPIKQKDSLNTKNYLDKENQNPESLDEKTKAEKYITQPETQTGLETPEPTVQQQFPGSDQKITPTNSNYNFPSLDNDKFAKKQVKDTKKKDGARLDEAEGLEVDSKLSKNSEEIKIIRKKAKNKEQNFVKYNQDSQGRIKNVLNTAGEARDKRLQQAELARSYGNESKAKLLEKKAIKSNKLAGAALNAVKTFTDPKEALKQAVVNKITQVVITTVVPLLWWIAIAIITVGFIFTIFAGTILYAYCKPEKIIRDPIEAIYNISQGRLTGRSPLREYLEDSGVCKSLNGDFCSSVSTEPNSVSPLGPNDLCISNKIQNKPDDEKITFYKAVAGGGITTEELSVKKIKNIIQAGLDAKVDTNTIAFALSISATESSVADYWRAKNGQYIGLAQIGNNERALWGKQAEGGYKTTTGEIAPPGYKPDSHYFDNPPYQMQVIKAGMADKLALNKGGKCAPTNRSKFYQIAYAWLTCKGVDGNKTKSVDYAEAAEKNYEIITCQKATKATTELNNEQTLAFLDYFKNNPNIKLEQDPSNKRKFNIKENAPETSPNLAQIITGNVTVLAADSITYSIGGNDVTNGKVFQFDKNSGGIDIQINPSSGSRRGVPIVTPLQGFVVFVDNINKPGFLPGTATGSFGKVVAVYYPSTNKTVIYSHIDNDLGINPTLVTNFQNGQITPVEPGALLGYQGRSGSVTGDIIDIRITEGVNGQPYEGKTTTGLNASVLTKEVEDTLGKGPEAMAIYQTFITALDSYYKTNGAKIAAKDFSPTAGAVAGDGGGNSIELKSCTCQQSGGSSQISPLGSNDLCISNKIQNKADDEKITFYKAVAGGGVTTEELSVKKIKDIIQAGLDAKVDTNTIAFALSIAATEANVVDYWRADNKLGYLGLAQVGVNERAAWGKKTLGGYKTKTGEIAPPGYKPDSHYLDNPPYQMQVIAAGMADKATFFNNNCAPPNRSKLYKTAYAWLTCKGEDFNKVKSLDYAEAAEKNYEIIACKKATKANTELNNEQVLALLNMNANNENMLVAEDQNRKNRVNFNFIESNPLNNLKQAVFGGIEVDASSPGNFVYNGEDQEALSLISSGKIQDVIVSVSKGVRPSFPVQIKQKNVSPTALKALISVIKTNKFDAIRVSSAYRAGNNGSNHVTGYAIDIDAVTYKGTLYTHMQAFAGNQLAIEAFYEFAKALKDTGVLEKIISAGGIYSKISKDPYFQGVKFMNDPSDHNDHYHLDFSKGGNVVESSNNPSVANQDCNTTNSYNEPGAGGQLLNAETTASMQKMLDYARQKSQGKKPDGYCLWHVNNWIDAIGYGKIPRPVQRFKYAYQYGNWLNTTGKQYGIKNLMDANPNMSPYDAPAGSIVVVTAGSPGTGHPIAGDIAVADGTGKFYNGGEMGYGGKSSWSGSNGTDSRDGSKGKVIGIFVADQ